MRLIITTLFILLSSHVISQTTFNKGIKVGPNGSTLDTIKVEGLNLNLYNNGNTYTVGIASADTLYDISFQDEYSSYIKNLNGSVETNSIDYNKTLIPLGQPYGNKTFEIHKDSNWAYCSGGITEADWLLETTNGYEVFDILSASNDTIYINGTWTVEDGNYSLLPGYFMMNDLNNDTSFYGNNLIHNLQKTRIYNQLQDPIKVNDNYNIVSKVGGMMWRSDNWLSPDFNDHMSALSNYFAIFDKYHIKGTWALNELDERYWTGNYEKYTKFVADLQAKGHEVADHGPLHTNYTYYVNTSYYDGAETTDVPGIMSADLNGSIYHVKVDTIPTAINGLAYPTVSNDGLDIMLWRGQKIFDFAGLNPFTYYIEGGGAGVFYHPDSIYSAGFKNLCLGGGKYTLTYYKHMGFNPPLGWIGKSEYFMDWNSTESITLSDDSGGAGDRVYSASAAIKKLVDQSAKHSLTIFRNHIQSVPPISWYRDCMDSIFYFVFSHQAFIRNFTGTQAAKVVYQSQTNPYINYMPANPITGQCFEDNIDEVYGDTMPDGWIIGTTAAYWEDGGSQGSKGYVSVNTGETTNLSLTRLYGIEKGVNDFTIDIKDKEANDTVYVEITYYSGDTYSTLSGTEIQLAFPSTANWSTNDTTVTFPYNTSYVNIQVWSRTDESYVDELTLKKKY